MLQNRWISDDETPEHLPLPGTNLAAVVVHLPIIVTASEFLPRFEGLPRSEGPIRLPPKMEADVATDRRQHAGVWQREPFVDRRQDEGGVSVLIAVRQCPMVAFDSTYLSTFGVAVCTRRRVEQVLNCATDDV